MQRYFSEVTESATLEDIVVFIATRELQEQEAERARKRQQVKAEARGRVKGRR